MKSHLHFVVCKAFVAWQVFCALGKVLDVR